MFSALIKDHKRAHGEAPSSSAPWFSSQRGLGRGRGNSRHYTHSYSGQPKPYAPHSTNHWRKTYSLNNKATRAPEGGHSHFSEPYLNKTQFASSLPPVASSLVTSSKLSDVIKVSCKGTAAAQAVKGSTVSSHNLTGKESLLSGENIPATSTNRTVLKPTTNKSETGIKPVSGLAGSSLLSSYQQSERERKSLNASSKSAPDMICDAATSFVSSSKETCAFDIKNPSAVQQEESHLTSSISSNRTVIMATGTKDSSSSQTVLSRTCSKPALNLKLQSESAVQGQTFSFPHKRSQFIWVKNQESKNSQPKSDTAESSPSPVSAATTSTSGAANIKQAHGSNKKVHRRSSFSSGPSKTSKYSWVSSTCSTMMAAKVTSAKPASKQLVPKTLKVPGKTTKEGLDGTKTFTSTSSTPSKRTKVSGGTSASQVSHASQYSWKAASHNLSALSSTPRSSRKGSVYRWTAQKDGKDSGLGTSRVQHFSTTPRSSSGFKLRSRTKIIRRHSSRY